MRIPALKDRWLAAGAVFQDHHGVEVVSHVASRREEYFAVRDAVGLTDFSFTRSFRLPEEKGIDFLDTLLAGNVPKVRFGRVLHTFLADRDGMLVGDCYVANNDQEWIFLCESLLPDDELDTLFQAAGAENAGMENLTTGHVLLSLDGFRAWEAAKKIFGPDVLGLPYLSIENYVFNSQPIRLIRAGKTSEFGYLLLAPGGVAEALFDTLKGEVEQRGGRLCGLDIHNDLRLEGRFFNIHREGRRVKDPLVLGLQWMIDFEKEKFNGREAILRRRSGGLPRKIIGIATNPGVAGMKDGAAIYQGDEAVAEVVTHGYSHRLNQEIGLAVFPMELAYSGLVFTLGNPSGETIRTISLPPIMPKSLTVKLDEM